MPAGSEKRTNARREEIINACEKLYQTMSFKEITIKQIGEVTSFSRTSIYNYFETKEEIFLALLTREYKMWVEQLKDVLEKYEKLTVEELAGIIADSLEKRWQLLKILSMNHYDLEENSRTEMLVEFKLMYGEALNAMEQLLIKFRKEFDENKRQDFIYAFFRLCLAFTHILLLRISKKKLWKKQK